MEYLPLQHLKGTRSTRLDLKIKDPVEDHARPRVLTTGKGGHQRCLGVARDELLLDQRISACQGCAAG